MPKILLINYSEQDAKRVGNELSIEVQRGYLATEGYTVNELGVSIPLIKFYIPESFAEFQAVYINFNIPKGLKEEFDNRADTDYERNGKHFLSDYWFSNRGYLVVFTGKDLVDLPSLGIPLKAQDALQTDRTAYLGIKLKKDNPLRRSLGELLKNISMPASHYLSAQDDKDIKKYLNSGHLDRAYVNSSSKAIGVYIDGEKDESDYGFKDNPQAMVLPTFKSLSNTTVALTRTFAALSPRLLPLSDVEWMSNDSYYPNSVKKYQIDIDETMRTALQKVKALKKEKADEIDASSSFMGILTQTGDELVQSTQWLLSNILDLDVIDVDVKDGDGSGNRKEDLLITAADGTKILAEVKGTKAEYPSPKYIGQATNHFIRKANLGVSKCILIINHDYTTEPRLRKKAYIGDEAELLESVGYVSYLDTRVLHEICLSVINGEISKESAINIVTGNGRIENNKDA